VAGKPFDASLKHLLETYAQDLVAFFLPELGLPEAGPVEVIDSDVATVSAAADKVFRVGGPEPWLFHLEVQASHNVRLAEQLLLYNVLLHERHRLPVRSAVLLLRPQADRASLTGVLRRHWPPAYCYQEFRYDVVRLWRQPVERLLQGGLGLLPLAPLADVAEDQLGSVVERIKGRVGTEAAPARAKDLWVATFVLMGLEYSEELITRLLQGVSAMEESVTYQAIVAKGLAQGRAQGLAEGRAEGRAEGLATARELLLALGSRSLGQPDAATRAALESITDLARMEELADRAQGAASWAELLGTAPPPSRR
jgi:predicted transposase YdaD